MSQDKALLARLDAEIAKHDEELNKIDQERIAATAEFRARGRKIMDLRDKLIAQRELHIAENPTPIVGLRSDDRLNVLRAKAGVATVTRTAH